MEQKQIFDPVHGFISLSPLMIQIIDTMEFQRLRDLKQLGACYFVYPSATHTRFEHSVGVCHLAGKMMTSLRQNQPELQITPRQIELVQIAGLIHDLGHGPFSHIYDNHIILPSAPSHEQRGCKIFESMISKYNLLKWVYIIFSLLKLRKVNIIIRTFYLCILIIYILTFIIYIYILIKFYLRICVKITINTIKNM